MIYRKSPIQYLLFKTEWYLDPEGIKDIDSRNSLEHYLKWKNENADKQMMP